MEWSLNLWVVQREVVNPPPPLIDFSALKSVFVQCLSSPNLLPLEAGLGAVFTSHLGPGLSTICSHKQKLLFQKPLCSWQLLQRICSGLSVKINSEFSKANICARSPLPECFWAVLPSLSLPGAQQPGKQLTSSWVLQNKSKKSRKNRVYSKGILYIYFISPNYFGAEVERQIYVAG